MKSRRPYWWAKQWYRGQVSVPNQSLIELNPNVKTFIRFGYTDREESENEKRRKKCGGVACQKSNSVDRVLRPCGSENWTGVPWGFSSDKSLQVQSPKKCFCHSNIPTGDKRARCKYFNLAFALFIRNFGSVCYSLFHVCKLNLDSVVFHSDFCLVSFLLF